MNSIQKKRERELAVVEKMIGIFCKGNHHPEGSALCQDCQELLDYARKRVRACPRMEEKTFCSVCSTHCFAPARREKIRKAMSYSGPKMIFHYPLEALHHMYVQWKYRKGFVQD